jgi:serine/threonine protein kinase
MDSRQVIARFEAERQALALMDHPNIARVLDAGTTDTGRPYFVMELVKGIPLTDYCDRHRLRTQERLDLFVSVCQAVQHAHQKGIIHRDLKPSNVLVAVHDVTPVVKVIDFGIAKATGRQLTERTIYTGLAQLVGTPMYMSPEQAGQSSLDVDTRSDIYSLGVLLYELLTGTTPFESETLRQAGYDEMRRIIREEEPPKPSTRLSTLGKAALSTVCQRRGIEPRKFGQLFRGELDWVVMKALEKDRNRRYESASSLAADVRRYLNDESVEASPPSTALRLRRWGRRHRHLVGVTALFLTLAIVGLAVSAPLFWREKEQTRKALAEARANHNRAEAQRQRAETNFREAFWAVENLLCAFDPDRSSQPVSVAELRQWQTEMTLRFLAPFCEDPSDEPAVRQQKGAAYVHTGRVYQVLAERDKAQKAFRHAAAVFGRLVQDFPENPTYTRELGTALHILAEDLYQAGRIPEANAYYSQAIGVFREAVRNHPTDSKTAATLAYCLCLCFSPELRDPRIAGESARMAVELDPHNPIAWVALGVAYYRTGQWDAAEGAFHEALRKREFPRRVGRTPALTAFFLAMAQWQCGRQEEARKAYQQAVRRMETSFLARDYLARTIQAEAAALLGIHEPPTAKAKEDTRRKE